MGPMDDGGSAPGPGGTGTTTARARRPGRPGLSAARVREALTGYALVAPGLIGVLLFVIAPAGALVWLSARKWGLLSDPEFVGPSQAGRVLADPEFLGSLRVTLLLALLVVPAQIALGLLLAVLLAKGVRGTGLLRALVIIPWAASPLALGVVWSWMLAPAHGSPAGPPGASTGVLASPTWALPAVALVVIWTGAGHTALLLAAGLASIPHELVEAARLDGATARQIFWSIKAPLLRPTLLLVSTAALISVLNTFDQVYALTRGGPSRATGVLAYTIYERAFVNWNMGEAAVMALAMTAMLLLVIGAQSLCLRGMSAHDG